MSNTVKELSLLKKVKRKMINIFTLQHLSHRREPRFRVNLCMEFVCSTQTNLKPCTGKQVSRSRKKIKILFADLVGASEYHKDAICRLCRSPKFQLT